jgi:putative ATPase
MRLTNLLRPTTLDEFVGQTHIIGKTKALYKLIEKKEIPHLFLYGKPGTGKTTLAKIIAKESGLDFYNFNATSLKIEELRVVFKRYNGALIKPLIFIDEVHRLSKIQQEVLLPIMEDYNAIIIGASTENPSYTLTAGIISRSFLYEFNLLNKNDLKNLLKKAIFYLKIKIDNDVTEYLFNTSAGDGRALLNLLGFAYKVDKIITLQNLMELKNYSVQDSIKNKDSHYGITSAMIKSLRGSDIDASLYYLGRLIKGGESIDFITRRLIIFASEDIGNANPNALTLATSTMLSCNKIGFPEGRNILGQCIIYLASSPKSNSSYRAINKTLSIINNGTILSIPKNIKNNAIDYKYPHDFGGWCEQKYIQKDLNLYKSSNIAFEKTLNNWINKIKGD